MCNMETNLCLPFFPTGPEVPLLDQEKWLIQKAFTDESAAVIHYMSTCTLCLHTASFCSPTGIISMGKSKVFPCIKPWPDGLIASVFFTKTSLNH